MKDDAEMNMNVRLTRPPSSSVKLSGGTAEFANRHVSSRQSLTEDALLHLSKVKVNLSELFLLASTWKEKILALGLILIQHAVFLLVLKKAHMRILAGGFGRELEVYLIILPALCIVNSLLIIDKLSDKCHSYLICRMIKMRNWVCSFVHIEMSVRDTLFMNRCSNPDLEFKSLVALEIASAIMYAVCSMATAVCQEDVFSSIANAVSLTILYSIDEHLCNAVLPSFKSSITSINMYADRKETEDSWVNACKSKLFWFVANRMYLVMMILGGLSYSGVLSNA